MYIRLKVQLHLLFQYAFEAYFYFLHLLTIHISTSKMRWIVDNTL